jgi:hypothetical protein
LIHPLYFSPFYLSHPLMVISSGLKIPSSFLYRKYINHIHLLNSFLSLFLSQCFLLISELLEFCSRHYYLFLCLPVFSLFYPKGFTVTCLKLQPLINFELILVHGEILGSSFSLLHESIQFSEYHLWKGYLYWNICFGPLCQKSNGYSCYDLSLVFYSVPLVFRSVFMPGPCGFYCYGSRVSLEVRYYNISSISIFAQDSFGYRRSFVFPYEL